MSFFAPKMCGRHYPDRFLGHTCQELQTHVTERQLWRHGNPHVHHICEPLPCLRGPCWPYSPPWFFCFCFYFLSALGAKGGTVVFPPPGVSPSSVPTATGYQGNVLKGILLFPWVFRASGHSVHTPGRVSPPPPSLILLTVFAQQAVVMVTCENVWGRHCFKCIFWWLPFPPSHWSLRDTSCSQVKKS